LLLMIAPLAAIPVFAIVGVPQFASVSASSSDDDIEWNEPAVTATEATAARDSHSVEHDSRDLFPAGPSRPAPAESPRKSGGKSDKSRKGQAGIPRRWLAPPDALDQWETGPASAANADRLNPLDENNREQSPDGNDESERTDDQPGADKVSAAGFDPDLLMPGRTPPSDAVQPKKKPKQNTLVATNGLNRNRRNSIERTAGALQSNDQPADGIQLMTEQNGWKAAAERLKELGIRKYRLLPQIESQKFLFACSFSLPENPRVTRRFEAEAETPLEAVQMVLQQVDEWRSSSVQDADSLADDEE
jgi:hypothetical protein